MHPTTTSLLNLMCCCRYHSIPVLLLSRSQGNSYAAIPLLIVFAYFLGSIPTGFILGKLIKKVDIRDFGSGNVGATNTVRVLGWKLGMIALLFDMFKGLAAVLLAGYLFPEQLSAVLAAGFAAICGHIFSVFLRFKGGKGVATSAGVFIALTPVASSFAVLFFLLTFLVTRYVSAGSMVAAFVLVLVQFLITLRDAFENWEYLLIAGLVASFIIVKHKDNIRRLLKGTENKVTFGSKKKR